jgi:hypothetical protein
MANLTPSTAGMRLYRLIALQRTSSIRLNQLKNEKRFFGPNTALRMTLFTRILILLVP